MTEREREMLSIHDAIVFIEDKEEAEDIECRITNNFETGIINFQDREFLLKLLSKQLNSLAVNQK